MSFTVSSLADYVNQESQDLILRAYFENTSAQYFSVQTGIKTSAAIQKFGVTAVPQTDSGCSSNPSGDATFTQATITVGAIKYEDFLCMKTLRSKWTQTLLRQGSNAEAEEVTFEESVANAVISLIKEHVETLDWQGDTTNGSEYLNKYDGLIKNIDAGSPVAGNTGSVASGTGFTTGSSGNTDTICYAMADARPAKLKRRPNQKLFIPTDVFDKLVDTLIAKNNFHIDATTWANYTMQLPGRNVEVVGVHGLDATNRLFLGEAENFFLGVDLENEEEDFDMWYEKKDDGVYYRVKFKRGVQVAYSEEIVQFTFA